MTGPTQLMVLETVRVFVMDYEKAFDLIDHRLLLAKLNRYDINPYIINWIAAKESNLQMTVSLDGYQSLQGSLRGQNWVLGCF